MEMKSILVLPYCFICPRQNPGKDAIQIIHNVDGGYAKHGKSFRRKPSVALFVSYRCVPPAMGFPVNLDHQPRFVTVEIGDIGTGRMLATKFQAIGTLPQPLPEADFRQGHVAP
jgi:hypothetical protein